MVHYSIISGLSSDTMADCQPVEDSSHTWDISRQGISKLAIRSIANKGDNTKKERVDKDISLFIIASTSKHIFIPFHELRRDKV